jgi:hypothetical protein
MGKSVTGTGIDVNDGTLDTGDGNDRIDGTGIAAINLVTGGAIRTGNGNDTINGGIQNFGGTVETGAGNDTVDARDGGFSGTGTTNLGAGNDDLIGFGSGLFKGGGGKDTLELTPGTYTVDRSGTTVSFKEDGFLGATMVTSEFEKLVAGDEQYDFASLSDGQEIFIA